MRNRFHHQVTKAPREELLDGLLVIENLSLHLSTHQMCFAIFVSS